MRRSGAKGLVSKGISHVGFAAAAYVYDGLKIGAGETHLHPHSPTSTHVRLVELPIAGK